MTKTIRYTTEQIEFLRTGYMSMNVRSLTLAFNARFGTDKTKLGISSALSNRRITCGRKQKDRLVERIRLFSAEQKQFLRDNYAGRSIAEMTVIFNNRFETDKTQKQIKTFMGNRGLTSGLTGCFEKGHKPWNTGTKGLVAPNSGNFKKGHVPANRKPLGSERICSKDGYILIKVAEQNPHTGFSTRWKHKQVCIWERDHGPVPKGFIVALRDGDKLNIEPENLMLISKAEGLKLNKHGYKHTPSELKPSVLALAKLEVKTFARMKKK